MSDTNRARALALVTGLSQRGWIIRTDYDEAVRYVAGEIEAALDAAEQRGAERALERAAKVAESFYDHMEHYITVESGHAAEDIAAEIRALPTAPPA